MNSTDITATTARVDHLASIHSIIIIADPTFGAFILIIWKISWRSNSELKWLEQWHLLPSSSSLLLGSPSILSEPVPIPLAFTLCLAVGGNLSRIFFGFRHHNWSGRMQFQRTHGNHKATPISTVRKTISWVFRLCKSTLRRMRQIKVLKYGLDKRDNLMVLLGFPELLQRLGKEESACDDEHERLWKETQSGLLKLTGVDSVINRFNRSTRRLWHMRLLHGKKRNKSN